MVHVYGAKFFVILSIHVILFFLNWCFFLMEQGINEKFLSQDYRNFKVQIFSADAQASYSNGMMVLVTGCLIGNDNVRRKFAQSFFLAPQDKGYFVLNDVLRFVDEMDEKNEPAGMAINDVEENGPTAPLSPDPGTFVCFV